MTKRVCGILFIFGCIVSIYGLILYSDCNVIDLPFEIENIFIKPDHSDGIFLNLSLGYIISAMFYLMLVYYPNRVRTKKVENVALDDFVTICTDAMKLIVLMYKNVSLESEWKLISVGDDAEFFNGDFYDRIKKFDAYKPADTLLYDKESGSAEFTWNNKLNKDLSDFTDRINDIISKYIVYLDEELVDAAIAFKNNKFITSYLGLPSSDFEMIMTGEDGTKYSEHLPIYMVFENNEQKMCPIFRKNDICDNSSMVKDYIEKLLKLRKFLNKRKQFIKNIAYQTYCIDKCGHTGNAITNIK